MCNQFVLVSTLPSEEKSFSLSDLRVNGIPLQEFGNAKPLRQIARQLGSDLFADPLPRILAPLFEF